MSVEEVKNRLSTDFYYYTEVVVRNNPEAIYAKLIEHDATNVSHEIDALNLITQFQVNGEIDKVMDILNVEFLPGQSSPEVEAAMTSLQQGFQLKSGGLLNTALSVVSGAINGFTGNTSQPQVVYVTAPQNNTNKTLIYVGIAILVLILALIIYKMVKK